jgi:hypothetical protein
MCPVGVAMLVALRMAAFTHRHSLNDVFASLNESLAPEAGFISRVLLFYLRLRGPRAIRHAQ